MLDVFMNTNTDNNETNEINKLQSDAIAKLAKIQESLKKAKNKYCKKRYAEDPEFRKKQIEQVAICQKKNPEKYKEYKKQYMREYRAKKKAENTQKLANDETTTISSSVEKQSEHNDEIMNLTTEINKLTMYIKQ